MTPQVIIRKRADFTGTLAQKREISGSKYVHLLFHTPDGIRICLSLDKMMLSRLAIGTTYRIKGQESTIGHQTYLQLSSVRELGEGNQGIRKYSRYVAGVSALFVIIGLAGTTMIPSQEARYEKNTRPQDVRLQNGQSEAPRDIRDKFEQIMTPKQADSTPPNTSVPSQTKPPAPGTTATEPKPADTGPTVPPAVATPTPVTTEPETPADTTPPDAGATLLPAEPPAEPPAEDTTADNVTPPTPAE